MPNIRWLLAVITVIHRFVYRVSGGRIGRKLGGVSTLLLSNVGRGQRILVVVLRIEKVDLISVRVHQRYVASLKIGLSQIVGSLAGEVDFLLIHQIAGTEFVNRRATSRGRTLNFQRFDFVRSIIVKNDSA